MQQVLRGSFQLMKSLNRSMILNKIRNDGPISRAEIAKQTRLTPPTVSSIVKELIESNLVMESRQGESKGGRKPTLLVINARSFYIIGIDVGPKYLRAVLTDLDGSIIESFRMLLPVPISNEKLLSLLKRAISQTVENYQHEKEKFIGIGIGIHGVVDVKNGVSLYAPILQLREIPIRESLEQEFNMMIKVENDARVLALGESWFGNGGNDRSVVTINVGHGIGAGVVLDGKLFYGENFIAGEIGHMTIDIGGPKCSCGNFGCLQTLAAGPAIAERAVKEISSGTESLLQEMAKGNLTHIDGELVYRAALKGDSLSIDILKQTGRYLGIGITNLIHMFNPGKIIIGGGVANAREFIMDSLMETIQSRVLTTAAKNTSILPAQLGEYGTSLGAAALILVELFSTYSNDETSN